MQLKAPDSTEDAADSRPKDPCRVSRLFFAAIVALFALVALPVVVQGVPLADDYHNCVRPAEIGLEGFLGESVRRLGVVRPARFVEIFLIAPLCQRVPFGLVILVPLGLTLLVAFLVRGLLDDLDLRSPWPEIGGAIWLLHPLGAEAALWPSALHVPLGLSLALAGLRLHRRGRHIWGAVAILGAGLAVEHVILAAPLAAWMVSRPERRFPAAATTGVAAVGLVFAYATWPGTDPRAATGLEARLTGAFSDLGWYLVFPAKGLGLHSIPLAIQWGFPLSALVLVGAGLLGYHLGPRLLDTGRSSSERGSGPVEVGVRTSRRTVARWTGAAVALLALVNLPLIFAVPHHRPDSPRTFTPTWLVLALLVSVVAARTGWQPRRWMAAAAGVLAAAALLSVAWSVAVRLESAEFSASSSRFLAERVLDGDDIAVCGVRRTVVEPAPVGAYALHELVYDWAAQDALLYHTGRRASFRLAGPLWGSYCPDASGAALKLTFDELLAISGEEER